MVNHQELLLVVDDNDQPLMSKERHAVHRDGDWHRVSHVWVVNDRGQILCHQRSHLKDSGGLLWDVYFGGHLNADESYTDGAIKEVNEEIGMGLTQQDLQFFKKMQLQDRNEFAAIYYTVWNGWLQDLSLEEDEVEQVRWFSLDELKDIFESDPENWIVPQYFDEMIRLIRESLEPRQFEADLALV